LEEITLEINTLGTSETRGAYLRDLRDFLESRREELDVNSQQRLARNPLRILDSKDVGTRAMLEDAPDLHEYLDDEARDHFDRLLGYLQQMDIEYRVNNRLVRGLDYYTGAVFEWTSSLLGAQNAVCGGGRYDKLVEQLGGRSVPAAGFACGMERLVELASQAQVVPKKSICEVWVAMLGDLPESIGYPLSERLRSAGFRVLSNCGGGSLSGQLGRANQNGALFAIIIGDEEVRNQRVTVKPLRSGDEQTTMKEHGLVEFLNERRKREQSFI
jgi:histidyl-tRNA synthetase